jgi:hypothetical protein
MMKTKYSENMTIPRWCVIFHPDMWMVSTTATTMPRRRNTSIKMVSQAPPTSMPFPKTAFGFFVQVHSKV